MPPNIETNKLEVQDYKDGSGLKFNKFDFVPGCQEISRYTAP